jgi:hypothetical protein
MIAFLATVQGSWLLAQVIMANMQHLVSYITSLWLNFVVDADIPHFCLSEVPPPLPLSFFNLHTLWRLVTVLCVHRFALGDLLL